MITILVAMAIGYLLGSIPSGVWLGMAFKKIDVREHGSKSIGATNVFRVLGAKLAIATLLIDAAKGFLSCLIAARINLGDTLLTPEQLAMIAGLSAMVGHLFPLYANFKGGKGVATGAGMVLFLAPLEVGFAVIVFAATLAITRYVSLSSILATIFLGISILLEKYYLGYPFGFEMVILAFILIAIILYTHKSNISRLIAGEENKLGVKK